ncbi:hypothetical protein POVWA2_001070 [Plasmodium ovale wallikeri]|uniref:Uncharacterized protein n=1 Tax=Plasmodium ovale wallikeri TaxID=864142 RepID=A0A1A8YFW4_PLAOA|nr:hypothetical protein POVWA1_000800 [Plasmodium ovale wallikeri]SBT30861.1 hypothetical protein POVWA2_001070 [Plasmodium ovale wallikeri]
METYVSNEESQLYTNVKLLVWQFPLTNERANVLAQAGTYEGENEHLAPYSTVLQLQTAKVTVRKSKKFYVFCPHPE